MITVNELGDMAIKDVIEKYPKIGEILDKHDIGCTACKVGICKLKAVVKIHYLTEEKEKIIFDEINKVLEQEGKKND